MPGWPRFSNDVATDLGTANTYVYVAGRGIVLKEPSIVAMNTSDGQIVAVGTEAHAMLGRTPPNLTAVRPLKAGVIADFDATEHMLAHFIKKAQSGVRLGRPRLIIGVPSSLTSVERITEPSRTWRIVRGPVRYTLLRSRSRPPWGRTFRSPRRSAP